MRTYHHTTRQSKSIKRWNEGSLHQKTQAQCCLTKFDIVSKIKIPNLCQYDSFWWWAELVFQQVLRSRNIHNDRITVWMTNDSLNEKLAVGQMTAWTKNWQLGKRQLERKTGNWANDSLNKKTGSWTNDSLNKAWFPLNVSVLATNQSCLLMQTLLRFAGFHKQPSVARFIARSFVFGSMWIT